ncbi:hypothetical protein H5410_008992 [Solanum commersonii]|uniref:Uncharacterized protein n=1 Tax=Solanum commersonii TaxID=4109 RepID=A0A9J6AGK6_SOLCO|nr:hypothetical protein H5410_008992 [Solanum commersonii]
MFRTISHLRSSLTCKICLPQALRHFSQFSISLLPTPIQSIHLPVNPSPSTQLSLFHSLSSPCSSLLLQKHQDGSGDDFNSDPKSPPRLFVVQPRFRPDSVLKPKLNEALNLANSLEEQRDGFYDTEFLDKQMPHHLVVQNPASRSIRADTTSLRERKFLNHFLSLSRPSSPSDQNKVDCVLYRGDIERSGRVVVRTGYLCSHFPLHLCEGLSVKNCLVDLCLCVGVLPYKIWSKCFPYIRADLLFKGESGNLP